MAKPRICILADVPNWAWGRKATHLKRWLSTEFDITIWYRKYGPVPTLFDLYHTFDFPNVSWVPEGEKCVTGCTAHVWATWGAEKVRVLAARAEAVHVNSVLLQQDMLRLDLDQPVYYCPNGVCPNQFRRVRPRAQNTRLVVGHQGKPNTRKGEDIIHAAVNMARAQGTKIDYRCLQRTSKNALTIPEMLEWYQDLDVIVCASDMDGTPNPMLEGAACEVALLANGIGNMPEFIEHGVNGWMVDGLEPFGFGRGPMPDRAVNHPDRNRLIFDYADAMVWADDRRDAVREMGRAARQTVLAGWTWEKQAEHYRVMWNEVLGG